MINETDFFTQTEETPNELLADLRNELREDISDNIANIKDNLRKFKIATFGGENHLANRYYKEIYKELTCINFKLGE